MYHKPELTHKDKEAILCKIIQEVKLDNNEEQEMSLRIVSEHIIQDDVEQLLMCITGIGVSGKSHVIWGAKQTYEAFQVCR